MPIRLCKGTNLLLLEDSYQTSDSCVRYSSSASSSVPPQRHRVQQSPALQGQLPNSLLG